MAASDTVAPVLTSVALPRVVNVSRGAVPVAMTVGATDDLSGVETVVLSFDRPFLTTDGAGTLLVFQNAVDSFQDGLSSNLVTISQDADPGTYQVVSASVLDQQSNIALYTPDMLAALGYATSFTIVKGTADTTPPLVSITSKGGTVGFAEQIVRGSVGLDDAGASVVLLDGTSVIGRAVAGSDGVWSAKIAVATPGLHTIVASATDADGNLGTSAPLAYTFDLSPNKTAFGSAIFDPLSAGGQVYALYDGLLGRAPDTLGLEFWADAFRDGVAPKVLAAGFLASTEGQARAGALDNATFVTQLFNSTLHRNPDAGGLKFWTDAMAAGTSRADVGTSFALSPEHLANIQSALDVGLFVPDADAAAVARVYYTVLGRAPDAGGLKFWTDAVKAGTPLATQTQSFLSTPEAIAKTGSLSTSAYVDLVYTNALGRHADADGLKFWTDAIDGHTASRVDVTTQIGQSPEAQSHFVPVIEQGWVLG